MSTNTCSCIHGVSNVLVAKFIASVLIAMSIMYAVKVMFGIHWFQLPCMSCVIKVLFLVTYLLEPDFEKVFKRSEPFFLLFRQSPFAS